VVPRGKNKWLIPRVKIITVEKVCGIVENRILASQGGVWDPRRHRREQSAVTLYTRKRATTQPSFDFIFDFIFLSGNGSAVWQVEDCHLSCSCATVMESSRLQNPQSQSRRVVARVKKRVEQGEAMAIKDAVDSMPDERTTEPESFANRKLIRPSLNRNDHNHSSAPAGERRDRPERNDRNDRNGGGRKVAPPEQTNAENFYYQKQMQARTPMVIVLRDGEEIHGVIEWYDKSCLKVTCSGSPNMMIYKPAIKYMYKEGENAGK
jgi:host factor-I protein